MKRFMSLLLIATMLIFASTAFGAESVIKLIFADYYTPGHALDPAAKDFIKYIEEGSNGRIKIQRFPAQQLGKAGDMLELASRGTADFTSCVVSYFGGQLPLQNIMSLPKWTTAVEGCAVQRRIIKEIPEIQAEMAKYNLIGIMPFQACQHDVGLSKKEVKSLEDLKGLRIATAGGFLDTTAAAYGIIPVSLTAGELYEAVQRGIVDGTTLSLPSVNNFRLNELYTFHTYGMRQGGAPAVWPMNLKKFNSLPKDLQKVILDAGERVSKEAAVRWDNFSLELKEKWTKAGMKFLTITNKDRAEWDAPLAPLDQVWLDDMNKKGVAGAKKVLDAYTKICKEVTGE